MGKKPQAEKRQVILQEAATEWRRRLGQLPLAFARMAWCAQHRDSDNSHYDKWLAEQTSVADCHDIIHKSHQQAFEEWLGLHMRSRLRDLKDYLLACSTDVLENGDDSMASCLRFCRDLVPTKTNPLDVEYFVAQERAVLKILRDARRRTHRIPDRSH